jgi:hypothetical protein
MKQVEDVLGKGWEHCAEGQKPQSKSNAFRKKLDAHPVFQAWLQDISRRKWVLTVESGRLFEIQPTRYSGPDGRDTRHIRELASVPSVLQQLAGMFLFPVLGHCKFMPLFLVGQNEQCN